MTSFVTVSAGLLCVGFTSALPACASAEKGTFQVRMTIQEICTTSSDLSVDDTADNSLMVTCENDVPVFVNVTLPDADSKSSQDLFTKNVDFSSRKRGIKKYLTVIYHVTIRAETVRVMKTRAVHILIPYYDYRSDASNRIVTITVTY